MKLGLAVEISPKVFSEQFTNCERMSHAASADSVLLSTWQLQTQIEKHLKNIKNTFKTIQMVRPRFKTSPVLHISVLLLSDLEADVLKVVGMPLYDLLDEVWMCGFQVRASRLVELELEASPQLGHVERLVPPPTHLRGERPVQQRKVLEDVEQELLRKPHPVAAGHGLWILAQLLPNLLAPLRWAFARGAVAALLSSFYPLHPETWRWNSLVKSNMENQVKDKFLLQLITWIRKSIQVKLNWGETWYYSQFPVSSSSSRHQSSS